MGSASFNFTGHWQTFNVPTGVTTVNVTINGGGSGGQRGGKVTGRLAVKDTDILYIVVGEGGNPASGRNGGGSAWGGGGAGGDGYNANGGQSGAGYSAIRFGSTAGRIACVAGGAGGDSGDGGNGGNGGGSTGQSGSRGSAGSGATGAATGGTQTQGGNGGTSSSGSEFNGHNASDSAAASAGAGGDTGGLDGPGGGGGGGGWRSGGGGQGGSSGWAPGGGGAGGSNYWGGLTSAQQFQGTGSIGNGSVGISWSDPAPANGRPNTPGDLQPAPETRQKKPSVTVSAVVTDPNGGSVRLRVGFSHYSDFRNPAWYDSPLVASGKRASYTHGLLDNIHYYIRAIAVDSKGATSLGYASTNVYSNYKPDAPTLLTPGNGVQRTTLDSMVFTWHHNDPDEEAQSAAEIRYYRDPEGTLLATRSISGSSATYTENPTTFRSNHFYLWQVRTRDPQGLWSDWSDPWRFFISGTSTPPRPIAPRNSEALVVDDDNTFTWQFIDPDQGDSQAKADLQYRPVGGDESDWIILFGDITAPGAVHSWVIPGSTFTADVLYEWQVRTYDALSAGLIPSDWSESALFRSIDRPGRDADIGPIGSARYQGLLGCGHNYAVATTKGGVHLIGALTPYSSIKWNRIRDDISKCNITLNITNSAKACELASTLRTWLHEVKVYRDDGSVWEGPITRIAYHSDRVEIEAWDVMAWVYRRIMKQGYNDTYPHNLSVVDRAGRIIINALSRGDPNVLRYLTMFRYDDDAKQSRVREDWASTAWEEVDDLAAKGGLDYTTIGRRIILWDTHRAIGKLPEMRDNAFSDPPVVTEYGMNLATEYGITNNAGLYASATRDSSVYTPVEMLSSAYGEAEGGSDVTLTAAAKAALLRSMGEQAERGISDRYPAPLVVRVPDNATLRPDIPVSIDYLVPGVWIPVNATNVCRPVCQWQKLDQVTVTETPEAGETIQVVMSPAPNAGIDPDADAAATEDDAG